MSKPEHPESQELPRALLPIDPRLGHGDGVTKGKMKHAIEDADALVALQQAAAQRGQGTTEATPRRPDFLSTEEHRIARELVGATGVRAVKRSEDDEDDASAAPTSGRLVTNGERAASAHLVAVPPVAREAPTLVAARVQVRGAEPDLVAGEPARGLPAGNPELPTMETKLDRARMEAAAEAYEEKRNVLAHLAAGGIEVDAQPEDLVREKGFARRGGGEKQRDDEAPHSSPWSDRAGVAIPKGALPSSLGVAESAESAADSGSPSEAPKHRVVLLAAGLLVATSAVLALWWARSQPSAETAVPGAGPNTAEVRSPAVGTTEPMVATAEPVASVVPAPSPVAPMPPGSVSVRPALSARPVSSAPAPAAKASSAPSGHVPMFERKPK